jgi:hypothetical protein
LEAVVTLIEWVIRATIWTLWEGRVAIAISLILVMILLWWDRRELYG